MAGEFILIVDDEELTRRQAEASLKRVSCKTATAASGKTALEIIREAPPDLLLTDIRMPEMDGITAMKKILEIDKTAMVIICSSLGQKEVVMEAIEAGAKQYIIKPFENGQVVSTIKGLLGIKS